MTKLIFLLPIVGALLFGAAILRGDETASAQVGPCGTANDGITSAEAGMLTLVNNWRANQYGAAPMTMSASASKAAQWLAEALANGQASGHTDAYGRGWQQRMADCGYPAPWWEGTGESFASAQSAQQALNVMICSNPNVSNCEPEDDGHLGGIEAPVGYKCAGVGHSGSFWVVMVGQYSFSSPCPDPIAVSNPPTTTPTRTPSATPTTALPTVASATATGTATATATATVTVTGTPPTATQVPPTVAPTETVYRSFAPGAATDD